MEQFIILAIVVGFMFFKMEYEKKHPCDEKENTPEKVYEEKKCVLRK